MLYNIITGHLSIIVYTKGKEKYNYIVTLNASFSLEPFALALKSKLLFVFKIISSDSIERMSNVPILLQAIIKSICIKLIHSPLHFYNVYTINIIKV